MGAYCYCGVNSQILRDVSSDDVTFTSVALSNSGRMLFCGTSAGTLRSIKFPLTNPGEWQEYQGHCKPIGMTVHLPKITPLGQIL